MSTFDRVLVVVAHPDDELLGVGGTILRHIEAGDSVDVAIHCIEGMRDRDERIAAAGRVANAMGAHLWLCDLPNLATTARQAIPEVEELVAKVTPEIVYTHHPGDLNSDHRALAEAVAVACRPVGPSVLRSVRWFETPSSTEWGGSAGLPPFVPNLFVEIDAHERDTILTEYESELRPPPHPRSRESLLARAAYWGQVSGLRRAEAFQVARETW